MGRSYNPLDPDEQERVEAEAQAKRELAIKREEDDWVWLMKGPRGRAIVWRLLEEAGVFRATWDPIAMKMAFNEGCRWYGTKLWAAISRLCPGDVLKMQEEASSGSNDDGNGRNSK